MKNIKPNIIPQAGWIVLCAYCGEQVGNTQKYCSLCKTQADRKIIFEENAKIFKENEKLGFKIPVTLPSWK